MTIEQIEKILAVLREAKRRPAMFFPCTMDGIQGFLGAFHSMNTMVLDMPFDEEMTAVVLRDRGWDPRNSLGPLNEMEKNSMSINAIIDELLSVEIEVFTK